MSSRSAARMCRISSPLPPRPRRSWSIRPSAISANNPRRGRRAPQSVVFLHDHFVDGLHLIRRELTAKQTRDDASHFVRRSVTERLSLSLEGGHRRLVRLDLLQAGSQKSEPL